VPQLDVLAFSGQIFWLFIILIYFIHLIIHIILPDLLLIFKTRKFYFYDLNNNIQTSLQQIDFLLKHSRNILTNSIVIKQDYLQKQLPQAQILSFLSDHYNVKKDDVIALTYSIEEQEKIFAYFTPFSVLVTPNDNLILFVAFYFFVVMLYYFFNAVLFEKFYLPSINELKQKFIDVISLVKQNHYTEHNDLLGAVHKYKNIKDALFLYNNLFSSLVFVQRFWLKQHNRELLFNFATKVAAITSRQKYLQFPSLQLFFDDENLIFLDMLQILLYSYNNTNDIDDDLLEEIDILPLFIESFDDLLEDESDTAADEFN